MPQLERFGGLPIERHGSIGRMLTKSEHFSQSVLTGRFAFAKRPSGPVSDCQRHLNNISLLSFSLAMFPQFQAASHHRLITDHLEAVERGELKRLAIFMPPRHGKSLLCSRMFPAWYLGRHPDRQVIAASYNSELATDFGRQVRNVVASVAHQSWRAVCGRRGGHGHHWPRR